MESKGIVIPGIAIEGDLQETLPAGDVQDNSLLKNAVVAFFNVAKCEAKLRTEAQNNDLRRYSVIASMRCRRSVEFFNRLPVLRQTQNLG